MLEVGCGPDGGVAPGLADAGYDVLAIDPQAPEGALYRRVTIEELYDPGPFAAVVAGRVLHHVDPLGPALDKLAGLAPLLIVDEFAFDRVDAAARAWHRQEYDRLAAEGAGPSGPRDLDEWRVAHPDLHQSAVVRAAFDTRYVERHFEWRPYLYRWLLVPGAREHEEDAIAAGIIQPIGFRYVGSVR